MGFPVYDFRGDIDTFLVTPQIRARYKTMELGEVGTRHSHDLGQEVFLVLQGQCEFEIDGETEILGPGQLCVALVDQQHRVRNVGDEQVIMFLAVTPHIQPTHTSWAEDGTKMPHRFVGSGSYHVPPDTVTHISELVGRHLEAMDLLAEQAKHAASVQREKAIAIESALASGDSDAVLKARDEMWDALFPVYAQSHDLAQVWNDLTPRLTDLGVDG